MSYQAVIDVITIILAWYHLFLVVATIIFNPFVMFICLWSRRLRYTSTFKLLAVSSINDVLCCLGWNQAQFTTAVLSVNSSVTSLLYCRLVTFFLQYSTIQFESWMLVSISLDRFLSMSIKNWAKEYFGGVRPYIFSAILAFLIIAINFNEIFTMGYTYSVNGTVTIVCNSNDPAAFPWTRVMGQICVYFGSLAPYTLLILLNSMIIYRASKFTRMQRAEAASSTLFTIRRAKRNAQMTRTILFITFLFILTSLPGFLQTGYFYTRVVVLREGKMIVSLINAIQFSYPALNFFILYFSNKLFSSQVRAFFRSVRLGCLFYLSSNKTNQNTNGKPAGNRN